MTNKLKKTKELVCKEMTLWKVYFCKNVSIQENLSNVFHFLLHFWFEVSKCSFSVIFVSLFLSIKIEIYIFKNYNMRLLLTFLTSICSYIICAYNKNRYFLIKKACVPSTYEVFKLVFNCDMRHTKWLQTVNPL